MRNDDRWGEIPDVELVRRSREGDEAAFGALVDRHHATVYRVVLSMVTDSDVAQDVTQDAFLKAFRALNSFRGDSAFRTWLLTIAANEGRGALRRRGRRRETALESAGPLSDQAKNPEEEAIVTTESERARARLQELPDKQRLSVSLRVDDGLSFKEIGDVIGSSEGAARVNYFHGIRRLRELME